MPVFKAKKSAKSISQRVTSALDVSGDGQVDISDVALMPGMAIKEAIFNPATLEATGFMKGIIKSQLITLFEMLYLTRLKPTLTCDAYMPWPLRQLMRMNARETSSMRTARSDGTVVLEHAAVLRPGAPSEEGE